MMKSCLFAIAVCLLSNALPAAEETYPRSDLLVEPAEHAKPIISDMAVRMVTLDARSVAQYKQAHIPGARRVDHEAWKSAFGDGQDAAGWSERIGKMGIAADTVIVIYDDASSKDAARIWWILRYWGHDHVRLLNGGWTGWKAAKLPTTAEVPDDLKPAEFHAQPRAKMFATKSQVLELLAAKSTQILDARSTGEFCGETALGNQRTGAMPGAKHLEWSDLIDKKTQRFKPAKELHRLFAEAHIDLNRPTTTHCQSGGRSSVMAFGLELMGAKEVRNYYNGWSEWGNAADTLIVVPEKKPAK